MKLRALLLGSAIVAAATVAVPASGASQQPPGWLGGGFLSVGPGSGPQLLPQIVDESGRIVQLRGVNVAGLGDYWRPDLKTPYPVATSAYADGRCPADDPTVEPAPVCAFDFRQLAELGYSAIRLPVSWSLLEPSPGVISGAYVDRIAQVVGWARQAGIRVVVDMHEDAWSKYVFTPKGTSCPPTTSSIRGFDGAPSWATSHTTPACAVNATRELDPQVAENAQRLLADAPGPDSVGLQEHFAAAVAALAKRFASDPTVAGYDLLNEPHPGFTPGVDNSAELFRFYANVVATIRAAVPHFRQLVFLEPDGVRNVTTTSQPLLPWSEYSSYGNAVFAPHIYTGVFTADALATGNSFVSVQQDYSDASDDASAVGLPLWVGEFGANPRDNQALLAPALAEQDAMGIAGTLWIWKENANDVDASQNWSVYAPPFGPGKPVAARVLLTSRPYPVALAGTLTSLYYAVPQHAFTLTASSPTAVRTGDFRHATLVFVPAAVTGDLHVRDASVVVRRHPGGGRDVWLFPAKGSYALSAG